MRPPTWTRNVTFLASPLVPVETVAVVDVPQPDRLAMVDGDTDGANTRGGRGRVVVVVAAAGPPTSARATPTRSPQLKRPMATSSRTRLEKC